MPRFASYDEGDEPIQGYRLVDYLGSGQFGEVWKAVDSASGKQVALKIIDLTHSPNALKEVRALNLVKNLNHPHLLPIFTARLLTRKGVEVPLAEADADRHKGQLKQLVIAMGLGQLSLSARHKQLNPDGTPPENLRGLPPDELIGYMHGAAKGIDYLNRLDHGLGAGDGPIVHCDVKPDNLMIVAGEVQVADCGVAVIVTPDARKTMAAGSPAYSPPELTGNKPGPGTDQYSLAIAYYELRAGRLPFPEGLNAIQVMFVHTEGRLDFSSPVLTDGERQVLYWATARRPADRYPSCHAMVKQLERALEGVPPIEPARVRPSDPGRISGVDSESKEPLDLPLPPPPPPRRPGSGVIDIFGSPPPAPAPTGLYETAIPHQFSNEDFTISPDAPPTATPSGPWPVPVPRRPEASPAAPAVPAVPAASTGDILATLVTPIDATPQAAERAAARETDRVAAESGLKSTPSTPGGPPTGAEHRPPASPDAVAWSDFADTPPPPPMIENRPAAGDRPAARTDPHKTAVPPIGETMVPPRPELPADPNDPLGKALPPAEMDTIIREIVRESKPVPTPAPRAATPPRPPAPPKSAPVVEAKKSGPPPGRKSEPVLPPPPPAPTGDSKPSWYKEAKQAEDQARKSGVPKQPSDPAVTVRPTDTGSAATQSRKSWKELGPPDEGKVGGKGKLLWVLGGAAGIGAVAIGGWLIFREPTKVAEGPQPTKKVDSQGSVSGGGPTTVPPPPPPPDLEKKYAAIWPALKSVAPAALPQEIGKAFEALGGDTNYKNRLATDLTGWGGQPEGAAVRPNIDPAVRKAYSQFNQMPEPARNALIGWRNEELNAALARAQTALEKLATETPPPVESAKAAVAAWQLDDERAKADFSSSWNEAEAYTGEAAKLAAAARAWHVATSDNGDLTKLRQLVSGQAAPAVPAALVSEYFRLAADQKQPIRQLREVRDAAGKWDGFAAEYKAHVDPVFQRLLAQEVRQLVGRDKSTRTRIILLCGEDAANGWREVALAEADGKSPPPDERPADVELRSYRSYTTAVATETPVEAAAGRLMEVYSPVPKAGLLVAEPRLKKAAELFERAGSGKLKLTLAPAGEKSGAELWGTAPGGDRQTAADWLAKAVELSGSSDRSRVLAAVAKDNPSRQELEQVRGPLDQISGLDASVRVVFALKRAAVADSTGKLQWRAQAAVPLITWMEAEADEVTLQASGDRPTIKPEERDKRQGALRTAVKQVLDDWTADYRKKGETPPASIEAAVGRLLAARGRLLAKFHVSYAKELPDGWDDYRKALQWLRGGATADDHAYAAKLCYGIVDEAVYPLLARRDLTSGDLPPAARAAWADMFEQAHLAISKDKDPECSPAHHLLGLALLWLIQADKYPVYRVLHEAAAKAAPLGAAVREKVPAGRDERYKAADEHFDLAIARPTRRVESMPAHDHTRLVFEYASVAALAGLSKEEVGRLMQRAIDRGELAVKYRTKFEAETYQVMGSAAEDIAWMTVPGADTEYRTAIQYLEKAVRLTGGGTKSGAKDEDRYWHAIHLVDLGRCQYRAAVYGKPKAYPLADALGTLKQAADLLRELARKKPADFDPGPTLGQAAYWLALAHWQNGEADKADAAFREAEAGPKILALYDRGRMAWAPRPGQKPADAVKAVEVLRECVKGLGEGSNEGQLLAALATLAEGKEKEGVSRLETVVAELEKKAKETQGNDGIPPENRPRAMAPYQHALAELVAHWDRSVYGKFSREDHAKYATALCEAHDKCPWILTVVEWQKVEQAARRLAR